MIYDNILETIGNTPIVRLNRIAPENQNIYAKLEAFNPLASVKDRLAIAIIDDAERRGTLQPGQTVVEATSGNTGIALAMVCAAKGYPFVATMVETFSIERRKIMKALGAKVILTPAAEKGSGMVRRAEELAQQHGWFLASQFENPANPAIHEKTTGPEIWEDSGHDIDAIVAGVGTGGTITGVSRYLKQMNPNFKAIAVEPEASPVISGGQPGPHKIQGIGAGFIPGNLDTSLVDEVITVSNEDAFEWSRKLAREEGIMAGISSGANICAASQLAARPEFQGKRIVTIMCSLGERYLSTPLFEGLTG